MSFFPPRIGKIDVHGDAQILGKPAAKQWLRVPARNATIVEIALVQSRGSEAGVFSGNLNAQEIVLRTQRRRSDQEHSFAATHFDF